MVSKPGIAVHNPAPAKHGYMEPVRVVLHDTEGHDAPGTGDITGIWSFWKNQGEGYDVHFIVDSDGNIGQSGSIYDLFYHCGGLNTGSIGIEQVGFASFTQLMWSRKRRRQLFAVARLLAWLHTKIGLPLSVPADVHAAGVVTHAMVSKVEPMSMGHTDPGAGYPLGMVLFLARQIVKMGAAKAKVKFNVA